MIVRIYCSLCRVLCALVWRDNIQASEKGLCVACAATIAGPKGPQRRKVAA